VYVWMKERVDVLVHASGGVGHVLVGEREETQLSCDPVGQRHVKDVVMSTQQLVVLALVTFASNTRPVHCITPTQPHDTVQ